MIIAFSPIYILFGNKKNTKDLHIRYRLNTFPRILTRLLLLFLFSQCWSNIYREIAFNNLLFDLILNFIRYPDILFFFTADKVFPWALFQFAEFQEFGNRECYEIRVVVDFLVYFIYLKYVYRQKYLQSLCNKRHLHLLCVSRAYVMVI